MQRYAAESAPLAEAACRAALRNAVTSASEITHLITVSCSGFAAPGYDHALVERLTLPRGVARTHVGFMGCHGLLNALRVAGAFAASDPEATVLVCALELCTLHQQNAQDQQRIVANALFGDGAAAIVVRGSDDEGIGWELRSQSSFVIPETADLMAWKIGNHGFEMTLSPTVPAVIRTVLGPWLRDWLAQFDLRVEDVASWAVHPGGPRILTATAQAAGFDPELLKPSRDVLASYGNMSSPTVAFILERLQESGAQPPCVVLGFGPGLTIEAALLA